MFQDLEQSNNIRRQASSIMELVSKHAELEHCQMLFQDP